MAGAFNWRNSLALKPQLAKRFYGIIALSTLIGLGMGFTKIDPIKALYWSAVINGVVSVPIMGLIMFMAVNPKIMGSFTIPTRLRVMGWAATRYCDGAQPRSPCCRFMLQPLNAHDRCGRH